MTLKKIPGIFELLKTQPVFVAGLKDQKERRFDLLGSELYRKGEVHKKICTTFCPIGMRVDSIYVSFVVRRQVGQDITGRSLFSFLTTIF